MSLQNVYIMLHNYTKNRFSTKIFRFLKILFFEIQGGSYKHHFFCQNFWNIAFLGFFYHFLGHFFQKYTKNQAEITIFVFLGIFQNFVLIFFWIFFLISLKLFGIFLNFFEFYWDFLGFLWNLFRMFLALFWKFFCNVI